ncbi:acyltransferase [Ramlibacter tataouinensis]|uniref:Acyltransferase n=1 Tax=Ramlibacter tataouinensis TaxID=94132 RepID=A0A140HLC7_9BURK|nr:acyltransferase [Ramlibacter tataouinensis]
MPHVRGALSVLALSLNTLVITASLVPPALLKLLVPAAGARRLADRALSALASAWVAVNNAWITAVRPGAHWDVEGVADLHPRGWYLVTSNHQSWVDILVLQRILHGHVPFLKFFLKRELIWVPVIGLAWWALDFPFMSRGSSRGSRGQDMEATRRACEKFKRIPTSVMNFLEGTRYTPAKHAEQKSPYRHLLKPKVGGLGIALATMGEQFEAQLDVTIVYPHGAPSFWDLMCGRMDAVIVRVQQRGIPPELLDTTVGAERAQHRRLSRWVEHQWVEKDRLIEDLLQPAKSEAL